MCLIIKIGHFRYLNAFYYVISDHRDRDHRDKDRSRRDDRGRDDRKKTSGRGDEEREIAEANALRAKLGLAPLER